MIKIELIYALPEEQSLITLEVPVGTTVKKALELSGILTKYPQIDLNMQAVGIFSRRVSLDYIVQGGDRIEIYRPLKIDPKDARRLRVKKISKIKK